MTLNHCGVLFSLKLQKLISKINEYKTLYKPITHHKVEYNNFNIWHRYVKHFKLVIKISDKHKMTTIMTDGHGYV